MRLLLFLAALAATLTSTRAAADSAALEVRAEDGQLVDRSGRRLGEESVGRLLRFLNVQELQDKDVLLAGIKTVPAGGLELSALRLERVATGKPATPLCAPAADGSAWGFPLRGSWTAAGTLEHRNGQASIACAQGALGKCLQAGFAPWNGAARFLSCTRLIRADYCGDGRAHTRAGIAIAFAAFGSPAGAPAGLHAEAHWAADGAHCIQRTRVAQLFDQGDVLAQCPQRWATQPACSAPSLAPIFFTSATGAAGD